MIFSRDRGKSGRRGGDDAGRGARHAQAGVDARGHDDDGDEDEVALGPEFGPYDISEAPDDTVSRLDLGALRIPNVAGVNIELEAGPGGEIGSVRLAHGRSRLQLGVYAAPRTEGIWDEIRSDLRAALTSRGAKLAEVEGEYGPELHARMQDGAAVTEVRHVGIDGPRWFVHGIYFGAAAVDLDQAGPLRDALRGLVVDRGTEARPVKETLPLRLPPEAAAQLADVIASESAASESAANQSAANQSAANQTPAATDATTGPATPRGRARKGPTGRGTPAKVRPPRSEAT